MTLTPTWPDVENPTVIRHIYYVRGTIRRIDTLDGNGTVTFTDINNCATRSGVTLDQSMREYRTVKLPRLWTEQQLRDYIEKHSADAVRIDSRTVDTGEKKIILGLTAKRFITTVTRPTKNGIDGSETIDGWYVEHERDECQNEFGLAPELSGAMLVTYPELPDTHHVGPIPAGLAVQVTDTIRWTGGKYGASGRTLKSERSVESISDLHLDQKIFEIPPGFRENPDLLKPH
jgi:hypothetical protein